MKRLLVAALLVLWVTAWAVRSVITTFGPEYMQPVTAIDFASIWTYSAALGISAVVAWMLAWLGRADRATLWAGVATGSAFAIAALANGLEDGLGASSLGMVYVVGVLAACIGAIALAVTLRAAGMPMLAGLAVLLDVAFVFMGSLAAGFAVLSVLLIVWRLRAARRSVAAATGP
jgi:hypothetical protein